MKDVNSFEHSYRGSKENANAVESTRGESHIITYKPAGKEDREARRRIWDRYKAMKESPLRLEAEKRWDLGDKLYRMWAPERDADDWQADIVLPDAFAAVQTHMQDTVNLRPRPSLEGVESSDESQEHYVNTVYQFAMDKTDFDIETYKARNCSAIRGDAFTIEEYRYEKRTIQDPVSVEDGEIKYKKREIVDYDDVYTRWVDNWAVFFDDTVDDPKYGQDQVYREVLDYDVFKAMYSDKAGFKDVDKVVKASSVGAKAGFFKLAGDMEGNDVEVLHYWNRLTDSYDVLANNVLIRRGPMPNRHKELPIDKWTFYPIPGQIWGLGIPQIIYTLVEERRSGRNMAADRNKMGISKMFLANDLFDLDEDDLTPRPHGLIKVNTNGLPIQQAIVPLEYGDVPASSLRFDEALLIEERRAHGLDDRPAQTQGGTATENAIISEAAQKRINLINTLQNWTTLTSIGRKKWSNIQLFYPGGRMEEIMQDNKWKKKMVYKTIKVEGREFRIKGDTEKGEQSALIHAPFEGSTRIKLDPTYARFLEGNFDIVVHASNNVVESQATKFARNTETAMGLMSNPMTARYMSGEKTVRRLWELSNELPKDWMVGEGMSEGEMVALAELENGLIMRMVETGNLYQLPATPGATEAHTLVHLQLTETKAYEELPQEVKDVLTNHIMEEHNNNPNTGNIADKIAQIEGKGGVDPNDPTNPLPPEGDPNAPAPSGGDVLPPGAPGGPAIPNMMVDPNMMANGGDVTAGNVA